MYVKDPLQIKAIERKLGRKLTYFERIGEMPVYIDGIKTYLELRDLYFPYDFLDELQLLALLSKN